MRGGIAKKFATRLKLDSRSFVISHTETVDHLVSEFKLVATVTGTLGWQAALQNVPVLMFGSYFYQCAPNVYKIESKNDLVNALDDLNTGPLVERFSMNSFLQSIHEVSHPC